MNWRIKVIDLTLIGDNLCTPYLPKKGIYKFANITKGINEENVYRLIRIAWYQILHVKISDMGEYDIFHGPVYRLPQKLNIPMITTIHDVIFKIRPDDYVNHSGSYYDKITNEASNKADGIICVSKQTKDEYIQYYQYNGLLKVIYNGCSIEFFDDNSKSLSNIHKKYNLPRNYIVYIVCHTMPRKNLERVIKAYNKYIKEDVNIPDFVIVADKRYLENDLIKNISNKIKIIGPVSDEDIISIIENSKFGIYASLHEGFGLPVIEYMASKIPCIASDIPCIREVAGNYIDYFNPYCIDSIASIKKSYL